MAGACVCVFFFVFPRLSPRLSRSGVISTLVVLTGDIHIFGFETSLFHYFSHGVRLKTKRIKIQDLNFVKLYYQVSREFAFLSRYFNRKYSIARNTQ